MCKWICPYVHVYAARLCAYMHVYAHVRSYVYMRIFPYVDFFPYTVVHVKKRDQIKKSFAYPQSLHNENVRNGIKISLKFVPKGPNNNIAALVQIMAWRRPDYKPLSEPMVVRLYASLGLNELSRSI